MKTRKIILFALLIALLTTLFAVTAYAAEDSITLSEDYRSLEYNGESYTYFNYASTSVWVRDLQYQSIDVNIIGDDGAVTDVDVHFSGSVINLDLYFEDSYVSLFYISASGYSELVDFEKRGSDTLYTYDSFGKELYFTSSELKGEKTTVKSTEYIKHYSEVIYAVSESGSLEKTVGEFICADGEVYYLDYSDIPCISDAFSALDYPSLPVWQVTDEAAKSKLLGDGPIKGDEKNNFLVAITTVILVIVFGILPITALVVCGLLLSKAHGEYKRLILAIMAVAAVALVAFIVMVICFIGLA